MARGEASLRGGDATVGRSQRSGKRLSEEIEGAWHNFPNLPGAHLSMMAVGRDAWDLVTDPGGEVRARCVHKGSTAVPSLVTADGHTYVWRKIGKRKILGNSRVVDLVDLATNAPILHMSGLHSNYRAGTRMTLTGARELHFPVVGHSWRALMSATDDSTTALVQYRLVPSKRQTLFDHYAWIEAVISPTAATFPGIELLVAVSAPLLFGYFQADGEG